MKIINTEQLYKKKKNIKEYLNKISPSKKSIIEPKPLCMAINRLPVDKKSSFTFRINIYSMGFFGIHNVYTPKQEMELLIAKFQFIANTINHNIKIASQNADEILLENVKNSIDRQILLNQIKVSPQVVHLNGCCDLKNLLITVLDPNSNEKINNVKSLTSIFNEIKSHELCSDKILKVLTPIYEKCVERSTKTVSDIQNDDISLDELFKSCLSENNTK